LQTRLNTFVPPGIQPVAVPQTAQKPLPHFGEMQTVDLDFYAPNLQASSGKQIKKVDLVFLNPPETPGDSFYKRYLTKVDEEGFKQRLKDYQDSLNSRVNNSIPMDGNILGLYQKSIDLNDEKSNQLYMFEVTYTDDTKELFSDYDNSQFQPEDTFGPSEVIFHNKFDWGNDEKKQKELEPLLNKQIIQETHVGTYTAKGNYKQLTEKLDYLKQIGVNVIQLMPLHEFPGHRGWGYDPIYFAAPENTYGRPEDLKAFVKTAHEKGIKVYLDVVLNHFGPNNEGNNFRRLLGNDYFDDKPNPNPDEYFGDVPNYSNPQVYHYFNKVLKTWIEDYHIDGLRVDSDHLIPKANEQESQNYASWKNFIIETKRAYPNLTLIAESHEQAGRKEVTSIEGNGRHYDARWDLDTWSILNKFSDKSYKDYLLNEETNKRAHENDPYYWINQLKNVFWHGTHKENQGKDKPDNVYKLVSYINSHDSIANKDGDGDQPKIFGYGARFPQNINSETKKLFQIFNLFLPRVPLFFMGDEFASQTPFHYFADYAHPAEIDNRINERKGKNSENAPVFDEHTYNQSKLDWNNQDNHFKEIFRAAIQFRLQNPALWRGEALGDFEQYHFTPNLNQGILTLHRQVKTVPEADPNHPNHMELNPNFKNDEDCFVIANIKNELVSLGLTFPHYSNTHQQLTADDWQVAFEAKIDASGNHLFQKQPSRSNQAFCIIQPHTIVVLKPKSTL